MIDLNLYNIIDLAYIYFCRVTILAIFSLARISTLPKTGTCKMCSVGEAPGMCLGTPGLTYPGFGFVCLRCMTSVPHVFEMFSRYFESKQYRNLGQDMSGKNGMYGQPNFHLVMTDKVL